MDRVYLDVCCLKRPFDDQRQSRIRWESAAVANLIEAAEAGEIELVRSPAHVIENDANPREDRRLAAALWLEGFAVDVALTPEEESRARQLGDCGFAPLDALHLALAEAAGARWFVTCDDEIVQLAQRDCASLRTKVINPIDMSRRSQ